jgi:hypothetical protein
VAIIDEQPSFLDDESWRIIPYTLCGRTMEDVMWNLAEMVPTYLHRSRLLIEQGIYADKTEIKAMHQEFLNLRDQFNEWFIEFQNQHDVPTHFLQQPEQYKLEPYNVIFGFLNLRTADILVSYWMHLFVLTNRALQFQSRFAADLSDSVRFREDDVTQVAGHICRSAEWIFFCQKRGFERLVRAYAPLRLVFEWYWLEPERFAEELRWCWTVLEDMAVREPQGGLAKHFTVSFLGQPRMPGM